MARHGFELDEFGTTTEVDRKMVRKQGTRDFIEGQVVFPETDQWQALLKKFVDDERLNAVELKL